MGKDALRLAEEWFERAQADYDFAKMGLEQTQHYGQVCFLCHQTVEKYLKGFLVAHGIKPEKTHFLGMLVEQCVEADAAFRDWINACRRLERHYIAPRYPVPMAGEYKRRDAEEALRVAESIMSLVERNLTGRC